MGDVILNSMYQSMTMMEEIAASQHGTSSEIEHKRRTVLKGDESKPTVNSTYLKSSAVSVGMCFTVERMRQVMLTLVISFVFMSLTNGT